MRLREGRRHLDLLRWGLVPFWAKDLAIGARLINARAETAPEKPAFRAAFKARRCVVPADGFYEWRAQASGKQPYYIHRGDEQLLAMASLWETWQPPGAAAAVSTYTLLTTAASAWMRALHERMPVILPDARAIERWLDPDSSQETLRALLRPLESGLQAYPVTTAVGNVRNDRADLLLPAPE